MIKRSPKLQDGLNKIESNLFGQTQAEAEGKEICLKCKEPITGFRDHLSWKEHGISGMCQKCQDKIFGV